MCSRRSRRRGWREPVRAANGSYSVDLSWDANTEADLAGYVVYRQDLAAQTQLRVNAQLLQAPAFPDEGLQAGHSYVYSVSAVDQSGNESRRGETAVVNVAQ